MITLDRTAVVVERPFTHPDHIYVDRAQLCLLIDDLCRHLEGMVVRSAVTTTHYFPDEIYWQKRLIIPDPTRFSLSRPLTIVGFFSRQRTDLTQQITTEIVDVGRDLVANFAKFPAVLAYYTRLLVDERNYANLVVLENEAAIQKWRDFAPHPYATDELSPRFYDYVRIYNGRLPAGGLLNSNLLQLQRVKYWDYRVIPTWHAVRQLEEA